MLHAARTLLHQPQQVTWSGSWEPLQLAGCAVAADVLWRVCLPVPAGPPLRLLSLFTPLTPFPPLASLYHVTSLGPVTPSL